MSQIHFGFLPDGFVVLDDAKRVAEFAYVGSPNYILARREPESVARDMLANTWSGCPNAIRERHYRHLNSEFLSKRCTRWPV